MRVGTGDAIAAFDCARVVGMGVLFSRLPTSMSEYTKCIQTTHHFLSAVTGGLLLRLYLDVLSEVERLKSTTIEIF